MERSIALVGRLIVLLVAVLLSLGSTGAQATIQGITGPSFTLAVMADRMTTGDGNSMLFWGYADASGGVGMAHRAQYPGPTLIVNQGDVVTISLMNHLVETPVSIVVPGHQVTATGGTAGLVTREAAPNGGMVQYTFTAAQPGTYLYHSGTRPEVQVEMGLVGALIVRPAGFDPAAPTAYGHPGSAYDREELFLLSEMDARIHDFVDFFGVDALADTDYLSDYFPSYWFINGRSAPDTMVMSHTLYPTQPYHSMPRMHPGDRLLMRVIGAGRDLHPFHHHGNHATIIARDGRLLESSPGAGPDLGQQVFTIQSVPGGTVDAIFQWTGKDLGWDMYGTGPEYAHACVDGNGDGYDDTTKEWCADHGKPLPVPLPGAQEMAFGGFYSGSPFLGTLAALPPGEGGLNPNAGFVYMWHSHTEKEMTNFDVFPGGMMTMLIIEAPGVPID